jgi:HTH-type transcriptional regulator/antitoxin HipB
MATAYPIRFAEQLRQHLRALRKRRGLTQAKLGQLLGVSQARIAEIEANPGLVNLEQMLQIFSALGVTLSLVEDTATTVVEEPPQSPKPAANPGIKRRSGPDYSFAAPTAIWQAHQITSAPAAADVDHDAAVPPREQSRRDAPDKDLQPSSKRNFIIEPKKGAW